MGITGDNIANAGTTGFKASRGEFQDLIARSLKGVEGGDNMGTGTKLAHITPMFTQGTVKRTDNPTDLAINGGGFFVVESESGRSYTRDGSFRFDKEGFMTSADGEPILGFRSDKNGKITNNLQKISLGSTTVPAKASEEVKMNMNLDVRAQKIEFDPERPEETSNFNTTVAVYDNVGTERLVRLFFNRDDKNSWTYRAMVDGKDAEGGEEGKMVEMAAGNLKFNDKGLLDQIEESSNSFNFNAGAKQDQKIKLFFGKPIQEGGDGLGGSTQYGSKSTIARHSQDGYAASTLSGVSFNDDGVLTAFYDNGSTKDLSQVALAKFENNEGLRKMGRNLFRETRKSGQAAVGGPGFDGRGRIASKSLELSNVDIANEFIDLMNSQRNFQANTRTISTADKMLQEIINIKR
jgi:flagellar hook protein FlgE